MPATLVLSSQQCCAHPPEAQVVAEMWPHDGRERRCLAQEDATSLYKLQESCKTPGRTSSGDLIGAGPAVAPC